MALFKSLFLYAVILGAGLAGIFFALPSEESTPVHNPLPISEEVAVFVEDTDVLSPKIEETPPEEEEIVPPIEEDTPSAPQATTPPPRTMEDPFKDVLDAFSQLEAQKPQATTPATPPPTPTQAPLGLNETVRASVVNILCTTAGSGPFNPISASGVFIHPAGVILTNAHVAQYLLLKDYPTPNFVECIARTGSPASPSYTLELLFIPPSWIIENASKIKEASPRGNGENDYALLRVTGGVSSLIEIPQEFPYLPVSLDNPAPSTQVLLTGYPAGFLGGITVQKELYAVSANATIGQIFTYGGNTPDLFSIGGTIVAQQGSSGGAVVRNDGVLVGLIVTSSEGATTGERDLRALSTPYIVRSFNTQSGMSLSAYISGNLAQRAQVFRVTTAPTLIQTLITALNQP